MQSIEPLITITISLIALIISIIALVYTVRTYLLKQGASIKGSYSICSSISCEDNYVSSIILENLKDRTVVIFKIFLRVGHNYFIELEEFDEKPLILKPFEAYRKEYDPIDLYSVSMKRIELNQLFDNKKIKKTIVLSTSGGKYVVRSTIKHWDPTYDFFKNHLTAPIHTKRSTFKGKSYGINAKYILEIKVESGREEVIPIYPKDYEIKKFQNFRLTKDCLENKDALEEYLYDQIGTGLINCTEIKVHDMKAWLDERYVEENKKVIKAKPYGWFTYKFLGPAFTKISNYRLRRKNKKRQKT